MTTNTEEPKTALDESQVQRHEAAQAARKLLAPAGFAGGAPDVRDVITLAEWILTEPDKAPTAEDVNLNEFAFRVDDSFPFPKFNEDGTEVWCSACKEFHPTSELSLSGLFAQFEADAKAAAQGAKKSKKSKKAGRDA